MSTKFRNLMSFRKALPAAIWGAIVGATLTVLVLTLDPPTTRAEALGAAIALLALTSIGAMIGIALRVTLWFIDRLAERLLPEASGDELRRRQERGLRATRHFGEAFFLALFAFALFAYATLEGDIEAVLRGETAEQPVRTLLTAIFGIAAAARALGAFAKGLAMRLQDDIRREMEARDDIASDRDA